MSTIIRTNNAALIVVSAAERRSEIRMFIRRSSTVQGGCQALLTIDQASELAAALANLVDAAKRGR